MNVREYIESKYTVTLSRGRIDVAHFFRNQLYNLFNNYNFKIGCEVGVHTGINAEWMFKVIPNLKLYLVDPYIDGQRYMEEMIGKVKGKDYVFLNMPSVEAAKRVPNNSLDFVYIDGNHTYEYMNMDLFSWVPKVKKGGIISGHDFFDRRRRGYGVKSAVLNYVNYHGIRPLYVTHWTRRGGSHPSFFFVKE